MTRAVAWAVAIAVGLAACSNAPSASTTSPPTTATSTTTATPGSSTTAGGGATSTTAEPRTPRTGGTAVVGLPFVPSRVNELDDDGFAAARWIRNLIRPGGYALDATGRLRPFLVTRDPVFDDGGFFIAEDGTFEVTWTIDPQARWSDGERVVAADFAAFHEADCPGVDREFSGVFLDADPGQVRVRFPAPTRTFRDALAHVMPSHVIDPRVVCVDDGITWPSTGPFVIDSVSGSAMELVRNPEYRVVDPETGVTLPYLDGLTLRTAEDVPELLATGAIDVGDGLELATRDSAPPAGVLVESAAGPVWEVMTFQFGRDNRNPDSLNAHLAFRQALIHALDRRALADAVGWIPSNGLGAASTLQAWASYDHDVEEARGLLDDLCADLERDCVAEPPTVVFSTTSNAFERPLIAEMAQEMWSAAGVSVELQLEDSALYFGESAPQGTYDVGMWAWIVEPSLDSRLDILGVFDPADPGPEGRNWYRWGSARSSTADDDTVGAFVEVLAAAAMALGVDAATEVLIQAEQLLADDVVVIPVATRPVAVAWAEDIAGPAPTATSLGISWNAAYWYRTDLDG